MTLTGYGVHSQCMLGNLAQHRKWRSAVSQSYGHKVGLLDGWSANRGSRNWRSKIHGKTKHSWSTISSKHQVNQRSVNWRSNLIWLAMEKPDLNDLCMQLRQHYLSFDDHTQWVVLWHVWLRPQTLWPWSRKIFGSQLCPWPHSFRFWPWPWPRPNAQLASLTSLLEILSLVVW